MNENGQTEQQMDLELQEIPGLFHTSSLKQRVDPPLEPISLETYDLKRSYDGDNNEMFNQYRICQQIGRGAFGTVFKAENEGKFYALKVCSVYSLEKNKFWAADGEFANSLDVLYNELNILKRLQHKNIAKCYQIIYGNEKIVTVNQFGDLGQIMNWNQLELRYYRNQKVVSYISHKYNTTNLNDITRIIFLEICEGVKYMHDQQITNRDIKVDNILCASSSGVGDQIKIIDFTTVRYKQNDDISYFATGTPGFRAPEHQEAGCQGYSCKATDIWSIGYSMYVFFYEKMPFFAEQEFEMDLRAKNVQLTFEESCSAVLVEAITKMTKKQWKQRITINEVIEILHKH